jgi:hypothetical protein
MPKLITQLPPRPSHKKGYRFGKEKIARNEKTIQLTIWLGQDRAAAQVKYSALELGWQKIKADDRDTWTETELDAALKTAEPKAPTPAPVVKAVRPVFPTVALPPAADHNGLTLHKALDQFVQHMKGKVPARICVVAPHFLRRRGCLAFFFSSAVILRSCPKRILVARFVYSTDAFSALVCRLTVSNIFAFSTTFNSRTNASKNSW